MTSEKRKIWEAVLSIAMWTIVATSIAAIALTSTVAPSALMKWREVFVVTLSLPVLVLIVALTVLHHASITWADEALIRLDAMKRLLTRNPGSDKQK